ncbi:MAG TPA: hypothetical protein DCX89_01340 [Saprospirales bacterium]|nr:hypothetical protein [Saprospirales bacterium]
MYICIKFRDFTLASNVQFAVELDKNDGRTEYVLLFDITSVRIMNRNQSAFIFNDFNFLKRFQMSKTIIMIFHQKLPFAGANIMTNNFFSHSKVSLKGLILSQVVQFYPNI